MAGWGGFILVISNDDLALYRFGALPFVVGFPVVEGMAASGPAAAFGAVGRYRCDGGCAGLSGVSVVLRAGSVAARDA